MNKKANKKVSKKIVIKQLTAINNEFNIIKANMTILSSYFETLIDYYKDEKIFE